MKALATDDESMMLVTLEALVQVCDMTCVMMADASGAVVWRAGGYITCARNLPTCAGGQPVIAEVVLKSAVGKPSRFASCPTGAGGVNTVGWAIGPVPTSEGKPAM